MIKFMIIIITILIIAIIILSFKLHKLYLNKDTLQKKYDSLNNEYEFSIREIERLNNQLLIYEEKEEKKNTVNVFGKKIIKNPIYKGKRALVGDYYDGSYKNTMNVLKSFGMIVDVVHKGTDIVDKIKHGYKCDIIFTNNIYKEGYDGPTTLRKLKDIDGFNIPVVIHTISENERNYFINICEFDEYIVKPLDQEKVKVVLDKFLSKKRKR